MWLDKAPITYLALFLTCAAKVVSCDSLAPPANGQVRLSGTTVGSRAQFSCNRGFSLAGNSVRVCLANGQWSGYTPRCKRKSAVCITTPPISFKCHAFCLLYLCSTVKIHGVLVIGYFCETPRDSLAAAWH